MSTPQHFRGIILSSMARTLWVEAFMCEVEERAAGDDGPDEGVMAGSQAAKARDLVSSMSGRDWMDVAPETPEAAAGMAAKLCADVERMNALTVEDGFIVALVADLLEARQGNAPEEESGLGDPLDHSDHLADQFGHYLVMQALTHGVTWEDDHASMPFKLPMFENWELREMVKL